MGKELLDIGFDKVFDNTPQYPDWCKSEAARFVWAEMENGVFLSDGSENVDKLELLTSALYGVTVEELEMFATNSDVNDHLQLLARYVQMRINGEKEGLKKNETIDKLITAFCEEDGYPGIGIREELQKRFDAQSFQDQLKIIRTFLESEDDVSREWCYEMMKCWWDDCLVPDIKKAWETYKDKGCAAVVVKRLPLEYVVKNRSALERADYAAVCFRLATFEDYKCGDSELTRKEFLTIAAHKHWLISDDDADELLFGFVLDVLDDKALVDGAGPGHGIVHDGVKVYMEPKRFLEPSSYTEPSLLHIVDMPFYLDALGKLGKVNTLKKLFDWNEQLKETLANYITNPDNHGEIVGVLSEGYEAYLKFIWRYFMEIASNTFPFGRNAFRKTHNKYCFAKQEQREYYPGYEWEEESPF